MAIAALVFIRRRSLRRRPWRSPGRVGDEEIRSILEHGRLEVDEPLDLREIREEEERFWNEERWE